MALGLDWKGSPQPYGRRLTGIMQEQTSNNVSIGEN